MFRSKATAYAILTASEVALQSDGASGPSVMAAHIAREYALPTAYAAKVMGELAKARVLRSDRGPKGGFRLARPANKITLLEIFEAAQGKILDVDMLSLPAPLRRTVNAVFGKITEQTRKTLRSVTLADLGKKR